MCSKSLAQAARVLRSLHFVPGGVQKFLDKALATRADALILDLEDSVAPPDKLAARQEVRRWLHDVDFGQKTVCVRINALSTPYWEKDLKETLLAKWPHLYMVPKVSCPDDLVRVGDVLTSLERSVGREVGSTRLIPIVTEVPEAPARANDIAKAPRVEAVTWGAEDLSAELGAKRRRSSTGSYLDVFQLCRSLTLLAGKAAGVQAIDGVFTDLKDTAGCLEESRNAADTGFDGKLTIHPDQIDVVNLAFSPTSEEVADADSLVKASEGQQGAFRHKGQMVDIPHIRQAQKILSKAAMLDQPSSASSSSTAPSWPEGPHHGLWLEQFKEGMVIQHALTRTVTEADNVLFTTLSLNPAKLHLDYEAAKSSPFKKPLVNSMFTVALLVGMSVLETTHGTTIANLGFDEVIFPKPVFIGDSIRAETEVLSVRLSKSDPTRGIVAMEHRAFNQRGELVCKAKRNAMMRSDPSLQLTSKL